MSQDNAIFHFAFTGSGNSTTTGTGSPFGAPSSTQFGQPFGFQQQFRPPPPPAPPKPAKPCAHRVLGVACNIAAADLTRVYRRLAKQNHPDLGFETERATRTRRMAMINAAYEEAKGAGHG